MNYDDSLLQDVLSERMWRMLQRERMLLTRKARKIARREDRKVARRLKAFSAGAENS